MVIDGRFIRSSSFNLMALVAIAGRGRVSLPGIVIYDASLESSPTFHPKEKEMSADEKMRARGYITKPVRGNDTPGRATQ